MKMDEETSAFSVLWEGRKAERDKKKKKKKVTSNDSTVDIKDLLLTKKKELANEAGNGLVPKKKRKQDELQDKDSELWKSIDIVNRAKKVKKNKTTPKSIFSTVTVTEPTDNFFFKNKESKKKNNFLISSTPKPDDVEPFSFNSESSKESKKKKKQKKEIPVKNLAEVQKPKLISNGLSSKMKKPGKISKSVRADSVKIGESVFSWMISPMGVEEFFKDVWEKKPLHIAHNKPDFYNEICSLKDFDDALRKNDVYFTKNIDVTSYVNGVRSTENPIGKARPSIVWDFYQRGRSIRMLNPQTFIPNIASLTSSLQEFFRCFVGANIYLTPPGTQGFAPHYDDIEAFVLQLEGEKHWLLYNPRSDAEVLPRVSSENFKDDEIGEPILEVTLKPGDLLYFPRGVIHQARCVPGKYSLHITVSCYQKNSWADLFEKMLPIALARAIEDEVDFRKGLPIDFLDHVGLVHSDTESENRQEILKKFELLMKKLTDYCPIDAAADQIGREFMHNALPPCLTKNELAHGLDREDEVSKSTLLDSLKAHSKKPLGVKLIRAHALRLVAEEDGLKIFYCTDNSKEYHALDEIFFDIPEYWARGVDLLIRNYPEFTQIKDLQVAEEEDQPEAEWEDVAYFAYSLWERGLLLFDVPVSEI